MTNPPPASLTHLSMPFDQAAAWTALERDGAVIIDNFLRDTTVAALRADFDRDLAVEAPGSVSPHVHHQRFHGAGTRRLCGLAARSPAFVELMLNPDLLAYGERFLGAGADDFLLNTGQLMVIGPDEPAQMLHRDENNWPMVPEPHPELTVSTMFALSDFTAANGATWVVPGSHRWSQEELTHWYRQEDHAASAVQAEMTAGSALLYSGRAVHGAGANRTQAMRYGMHLSYVLAWLRPEEHHQRHVPLAVAETLPPRAQELLGWTTFVPTRGGRLGLVDFQEVAATGSPR